MKYIVAALVAAYAVQASPFPQAVTAKISPSAPAPSGCTVNYPGSFGVAVMNITSAAGGAPVSSIADGQPQASSGAAVSTIGDGQPQASSGAAPVSTIGDGQPQASTGVAPVSTIADGQPQAATSTIMPVTQISDGQIQATTMQPIAQISDGQIQHVQPVTQISDGQIQAKPSSSVAAVSTIADGQPQATTGVPAISTIADGQPQATTGVPAVSTIADGQPQASTGASAVSTIADGQPQASGSAVSTIADGQPQATPSASASSSGSASGTQMVACKASDSLTVMLADGVLTDNQGRTGYIAANYQFQFDGPPQAGALYTAGWSVCGNGSLALGGSSTFYQCLSGNFYNLYDRNWAPQCNPITINAVKFVDCA